MHTESFSDYCDLKNGAGLRPYDHDAGGGEIAAWRLVLSLNDLGRAFLVVERHLAGEDEQ